MIFHIVNEKSRAAAVSYIQKLPDRHYRCEIRLHRDRRSIPQNSLYWLWIGCITDETGADRDAIHEEFKDMFLPFETVKALFNVNVKRPVSTSSLDTAQFTAYLEKIQAFAAAELGIFLPTPEDMTFEAFEQYYKQRI